MCLVLEDIVGIDMLLFRTGIHAASVARDKRWLTAKW